MQRTNGRLGQPHAGSTARWSAFTRWFGIRLAPALALALAVGVVSAQGGGGVVAPAQQNQLSLATSAVVELPRDLMTVVLSTTREGNDPAAVQAAIRQSLDTALAEARRAARPGQVEVQTGSFALQPRYSPKGGLSGWIGSAELILEGRDMTAIGQLAGRIQTLSVARVGYGLSREARERVEAEATAQAVERFRARASELARLFGFASFTLGEVNVSSADAVTPMPMLRAARTMSSSVSVDEALPVEAGKGSVTITVNGTVRLVR